jgi:CDP-diacylglycerol--glycerol-3-phosphate 3-phosphatidyltransferase
MKINLANRITLLRLALVFPFLTFTINDMLWTRVAALILFIVASLTDLWDGRVARARKEVTVLGTFLDPLADKFLISAAFIAFVQIEEIHVPAWMVVLIIGREFLITGLRALAATAGRVLPAQPAGKFKTTSQIVAIITILVILTFNSALERYGGMQSIRLIGLDDPLQTLGWILRGAPYWLTFITTCLTIISGYIYIRANIDLFDADRSKPHA